MMGIEVIQITLALLLMLINVLVFIDRRRLCVRHCRIAGTSTPDDQGMDSSAG